VTEMELENEYAALLAYAYCVCADEREAEELVSDTMLSVLAGKTSLAEIENPAGYLRRIFHRRKNDRLREKYRSSAVYYPDGASAERLSGTISDSAARTAEREEAAVRRELGRLAALHREVMIRFYMHRESVSQIAEALHIPPGTVKYRLSAGRSQVRDGITHMETYSEISYAPKTLSVGIWGWTGENGTPFEDAHSSLLAENILICAYEKPLPIHSLSSMMGVPAPYLESEIEKLIRAELMGRTPQGLVYTRMYLTSPDREYGDIPAEEALAKQYAGQLYEILETECSHAMKTEPFLRFSDKQKATLLLHLMNSALIAVRYRLLSRWEPNRIAEPPLRPDGGKWLATGHIRQHDSLPRHIYEISGPAQSTVKMSQIIPGLSAEQDSNAVIMFDTDSVLGASHREYRKRYPHLRMRQTAMLLASFVNPDIRPTDGRVYEIIPDLEELHLLRRDENGQLQPDIPMLSWEETPLWNEAELAVRKKIEPLLEQELYALYKAWVNPIPAHVDEAEYFRHAGALSAFPTAVLLEIVRQNRMPWKAVIGETPLVYIGYKAKK